MKFDVAITTLQKEVSYHYHEIFQANSEAERLERIHEIGKADKWRASTAEHYNTLLELEDAIAFLIQNNI